MGGREHVNDAGAREPCCLRCLRRGECLEAVDELARMYLGERQGSVDVRGACWKNNDTVEKSTSVVYFGDPHRHRRER